MTASGTIVINSQRIARAPPEGFVVEWQGFFNSPDGLTTVWGACGPRYQRLIEELWVLGATSMDYQPGATQTYILDLERLLQVRTGCSEGRTSERAIRRVFVPQVVETEPTAVGSMTGDRGSAPLSLRDTMSQR